MNEMTSILVAAGGLTALVAWSRARAVVVPAGHRGLMLRHGRFEKIVEPGRHRLWRSGRTLEVVDCREQTLLVAAQEVPAKDRVTAKFSVAVTFRVADPCVARLERVNATGELYLAAQLALRTAVRAQTLEELLSDHGAASTHLEQRLKEVAPSLGFSVTRACLKDITLGGDLKHSLNEVLRARAEAQAKLERARGETAALRSLANAAKMCGENRDLLRLRTLQTIQTAAENVGNTLVVGLDAAGRASWGDRNAK